ncbi:putative zinc-binding metallopeptidase [Antrihabitans sp. YC2-6]|uniref:zinc-binding metallopeptidase family protein n=1 Tax=Antrihabitans sp. YC2-6 TaxID=2799498 RepID=UPI0018F4BB1E|nr:putative zinc-binding metallopeptidase [Antrihabitans sp. YC2-6]MBJ8347345.1 putative zinc-binding metallopeptidase [Antrihabitans sp. YC2-6]
MRDFGCPHCGQQLTFENSLCLSCRSRLGFSLAQRTLVVIGRDPEGDVETSGVVDSSQYRLCKNLHLARCNWVVETSDEVGLCESCTLTRTRPSDTDKAALDAFADAEGAKRRLIFELVELGLPIIGREQDTVTGLAFDLLSSRREKVMTGHFNGVITLDLAESDDVHREQLRVEMAEPYRTVLGHFRHEIGHYYFGILVGNADTRAEFESLFGDPDSSYQDALDRHYREGAPAGWERTFVSSYATMHPSEDWAETFAHYLHIRDTVDTAAAFGFARSGVALDHQLLGASGFDRIIEEWLPLSWALNQLNRSMGRPDLYPFVLPAAVLEKMRFVYRLVTSAT